VSVPEVRERVRATGLLTHGGGHVVVMLSGGRDSVCLLDVAVALCGAESVHALHINYGLRAESGDDEAHCRELCARLGVEIAVTRSSRPQDASGNLHAWAREVRYRAAHELAKRLEGGPDRGAGGSVPKQTAPHARVGHEVAEGAVGGVSKRVASPARAGHDVAEGAGAGVSKRRPSRAIEIPTHPTISIATGHTATDQVETILYRLASSPGRRALLGMSAREGRLVRPLLGLTRQATADYCLERKLAWREDASNDSERYARARVRHGLVPALDAVHPAAQSNVLRTAELLREETDLLDALVDAELQGRASIPIERLRELAPALRRLVVIRLAEDAAGAFVPQAGERVEEILALGARGGRAELHVGGLACAVVEGGELRMAPIEPRPQHDPRG
jgi:tRNA(Ile)-lysidine synthase TilS/MesJ